MKPLVLKIFKHLEAYVIKKNHKTTQNCFQTCAKEDCYPKKKKKKTKPSLGLHHVEIIVIHNNA
jgi:hypothetical protein